MKIIYDRHEPKTINKLHAPNLGLAHKEWVCIAQLDMFEGANLWQYICNK